MPDQTPIQQFERAVKEASTAPVFEQYDEYFRQLSLHAASIYRVAETLVAQREAAEKLIAASTAPVFEQRAAPSKPPEFYKVLACELHALLKKLTCI